MPDLTWVGYFLWVMYGVAFPPILWIIYRVGEYMTARILCKLFPRDDAFVQPSDEGPFRTSTQLIDAPIPRGVRWRLSVIEQWTYLRKLQIVGWSMCSGFVVFCAVLVDYTSTRHDAEVEVVSRSKCCVIRLNGLAREIGWWTCVTSNEPPLCPTTVPPEGFAFQKPQFFDKVEFRVNASTHAKVIGRVKIWDERLSHESQEPQAPAWFRHEYHRFLVGSRWKTKVNVFGEPSYERSDWIPIEPELPHPPPSRLPPWPSTLGTGEF